MQQYYIINQTNYRRKTEIFGIKTATILRKNRDNRIYKNRDNKTIIFITWKSTINFLKNYIISQQLF